MKKLLLCLLVFTVLLSSLTCYAQGFVKLGECPVVEVDNKANVIVLDPYENEIYGNPVEISEDEWYATRSFEQENNPAFPYNDSAWRGQPSAFNDGIKFEVVTAYVEDYGDDQMFATYQDIDNNIILQGLPGGWQRTWEHFHYYNFGYFTEAAYEIYMEDYAEAFPANFDLSYSTITNAFTGQVYKINTVAISSIDNLGNVYFSVPVLRGGVYSEKYYRAKLKKSAVVTVYANGQKIGFDQIPYIKDGRTLVPLRAIFEKLGANVQWDEATSTVTATRAGTEIKLTIGSKTAYKNGQPIEIDVPAEVLNGRTLVPVRFVSECFGLKVEWNDAMQKVSLWTN